MKQKSLYFLKNQSSVLFLFLLFLFFAINKSFAQTCTKPFHLVVLGSSTAYGNGASSLSKAWVYLYKDSLLKINPNYIVDDLAIPGTTTYSAQPDSYKPPKGRPAPIQGSNITTAIALHADAVIINFPSNDAVSNYSMQEQKNNFLRITNAAAKHNILIWVASPQPRNNLSAAQVEGQKKLFEWIQKTYKEKAIDFHTGLASSKDSILYIYNSGDGIHVNDGGHKLLYNRVLAEHIPDSLCRTKQRFEFAFTKR